MSSNAPPGEALPSGWQSADVLDGATTSATLREWYVYPGSLARRVRAYCADDFRLQVVRQACVDLEMFRALNPPFADQEGWLRETVFHCRDAPWVFARTLAPMEGLGRMDFLVQAGNQAIGDALHARSDAERGKFSFRILGPRDRSRLRRDLEALEGLDVTATVVARRSVVRVGADSMLVIEAFLPAMLAALREA